MYFNLAIPVTKQPGVSLFEPCEEVIAVLERPVKPLHEHKIRDLVSLSLSSKDCWEVMDLPAERAATLVPSNLLWDVFKPQQQNHQDMVHTWNPLGVAVHLMPVLCVSIRTS